MQEEPFAQAKVEFDKAQAEQGVALRVLAGLMEERAAEIPSEVLEAWKDWQAKLQRTIETGEAAKEIGEDLKRDLEMRRPRIEN